MLKPIVNNFVSEIKSNKALYTLLFAIFISAFYVRVYRVNDLLQFYYDQGRDALVIWKFLHEGKPFLIGPVTGLAGIFLGPFYYYLITPFYFIGGGNPVYPAVFLAFLTTIAVGVLYILGKEMHSRVAGFLAAAISSFSYFIITGSRWLSNPTPILLTSVLLLWSMWMIAKGGSKKWWLAVSLLIGISLQLEAASAFFYIPMIFIFAFFNRKSLPDGRNILLASIIFILTLTPQIIFNLRHDNILLNNFLNLFLKEKAFRGITKFILEEKMKFFWRVFVTKIYTSEFDYAWFFLSLSASTLYVKRHELKDKALSTLLIFVLTPVPFYIFFQGNFGNLFEYYLSGYFLPFILLFSVGLSEFARTNLGKIFLIFFIYTFMISNIKLIRNFLTSTPATRPLALEDQRKSIDWIFNDAEGREFNLDVYVPPVIPYAYDYLFLWLGTDRCGAGLCGLTKDKSLADVYLLYEDDPPHPERLRQWLNKYENNTQIVKTDRFGGITVQKRIRFQR